MTFTNIANDHKQAVQAFQRFSADDQLALLWFIYDELKDSISPKGGADTAGFNIAQGTIDQLKQKSQEEQLQAQRDVITGANSFASDAYADFNSSNRLAFWYLLAQAMETGEVVQVPSEYQLPSEAQEFLSALRSVDFNDQITFMRNVVSLMGKSPKEGALA